MNLIVSTLFGNFYDRSTLSSTCPCRRDRSKEDEGHLGMVLKKDLPAKAKSRPQWETRVGRASRAGGPEPFGVQ